MNKNSCLFVVDVQDGFVSEKTKHIPPRIQSLLKNHSFELIVFTRFVNAENSPYIRFLNWKRFLHDDDIRIAEELQPFTHKDNAKVFDKSIYSGISSEVLAVLQQACIHEAFVCGIDTDCCVLKTAVDLFEQGIQPRVLAFYSASNGGQVSHEAALTILTRAVGKGNIMLNEFQSPVQHVSAIPI